MPIVAGELGDLQLYGWVYTAFFLGNLLGVVLAGGALDRMPLHRPFTAGLVLFGAGLVIGGLAPSMQVLVLARFVQGLGGGAVGPTAYVAIGRVLPARLQPRMFALLSTAWVVPGIIGPSIAAVVGEVASWRWVFLGLVPFLVVAGGLAVTALRRVDAPIPDAEHDAAHATLRRLPDALLAAGGAGLLVAGLTAQDPRLLVGGVVLGGLMLVPAYPTPHTTGDAPARDRRPGRRAPARRDDVRVLLRRRLPAAAPPDVARHARDAHRRRVHRDHGLVDGRHLVPGAQDRALGAAPVRRSRLRDDRDRGALTIAVVFKAVPPELAVVTWVLPGIGMGFMYSAVTLVVLRGSNPAEQGSASSALQLSDILGTALGTGVAGAITAAGERAGGDGLGVALAVVFGVSLVSALLGMIASRRIGAVPARAGAPDGCGRLATRRTPRRCRTTSATTGGPRSSMSAETLRAKIREIPDFPKPGILFYDITTLLKDPASYKEAIDLMLEPYRDEQVDLVVGMESRGFIFSSPMAYLLNTGLVPVRKLGKLPAETLTVEYALEYGSNTLEIHRDAIQPGQKVLIVDDLLATGGTVRGHDRADRAPARARSSASRSSSSSTSSRAATVSRVASVTSVIQY